MLVTVSCSIGQGRTDKKQISLGKTGSEHGKEEREQKVPRTGKRHLLPILKRQKNKQENTELKMPVSTRTSQGLFKNMVIAPTVKTLEWIEMS